MNKVKYKTDLRACLEDILKFIEEQIDLATANPSQQMVSIDAASGAFPFIRERLREDLVLNAQFMLVLDFSDLHLKDNWDNYSRLPSTEFVAKFENIKERLRFLKKLLKCDTMLN